LAIGRPVFAILFKRTPNPYYSALIDAQRQLCGNWECSVYVHFWRA
jgi:hypothetical protein